MSLWRQLTRGIRALTRPTTADRDVADEVEHYLEQATAALVASGLSPDEARRAARLELGSPTGVREQVRGYGWENVIGGLLADLRFAARRLKGSPAFTVVSVLTLALGIGATTAIFSAVNPVLFEPLPYPEPDRVAMIWDHGGEDMPLAITFGTYREVVERSRSFDALAVMKSWQPTMTGPAEPERLDGQRVSAQYFRVLGVPPLLGREFDQSDDRLNGPRVAILGHGLWQRRFGGDQAIIGRQIRLDDESYTVVGVMPSGFENVLAPSAEVWAPLQYDRSLPLEGREWGHHLSMVGRLRHGSDIDQAKRELDLVAHAPLPEFPRPPWAAVANGFILNRLQDDVTQGVKPALLAVLGAVVLVLAIACVNVTNLLLARGAQRRGEFAMRAALGAGRGRLIRQLLTESLLLALLGGTFGLLVAQVGVRALLALSPPGLPRVAAIGLDGAVFAFALGITTLIGLAVGLVPALHASRGDLHLGLQQSARGSVGGHQVTRRTLVVAEVALALILLVSAGLLWRSLNHLFAIAPGFDASRMLTMQVQTSGGRFDKEATNRFFAQAEAAVRAVPGVTVAAFTSQLPLSGDYSTYGVSLESNPDSKTEGGSPAFRYAVSPGYFETMRIPLRSGRLLDSRDVADAPPVVLVSESLAKTFPGRNPIGQRVHVGPTDHPWYTVVGVVGDVSQASLALSRPEGVYMTGEQWHFRENVRSLVVRARGEVMDLAPAIRNAIWSVDKDQPVVRVATMEEVVASSAAERRFALIVFEAFGVAALVLAAIGIYGVLSGGVTERLREIGVRSALGASRGAILGLVVRQGMTLTGIGVVIGLSGAAVASQALVTLLFGVSRLDALTYLAVVTLLLGVSGIACWLPAWRAAQVDPSITLRE